MSTVISKEIYKELRYLILKNINIITVPVYYKYFGKNEELHVKDFFNLRKDIVHQLKLNEKYGVKFEPNLHDKYNNSSFISLKTMLNIP